MTPAHSFVVFCEGPTDITTVKVLATRVLTNLADWLDASLLTFRGCEDNSDYTPWRTLRTLAAPRRHGFNARGPDFPAVWNALHNVPDGVDGVILLRDADNHGAERRESIRRAIEAFQRAPSAKNFKVAAGVAEPKIESWILAAVTTTHQGLPALRQALGFHPVLEAYRLTAVAESGKTNAKRVLNLLEPDTSRHAQMLAMAKLEQLVEHGLKTGLQHFLCEVRCKLGQILVPQIPPCDWCDCSTEVA